MSAVADGRAAFVAAIDAAFKARFMAVSVSNGPVESIAAPAAVVLAGSPYREPSTIGGEEVGLDVILIVNRTITGTEALDDLDEMIDVVRDACDGSAGYAYEGVNAIGETQVVNDVAYWSAVVAVSIRV